ncbi:MAG: hypothetical protein ACC628_23215 [Pirellulaceae bacterium]
MATVEKLGGNWVIVRGNMTAANEIGIYPAEQETTSNREFWTGDLWVGQYGFAKQFAMKEEAETYLAQHQQEMA